MQYGTGPSRGESVRCFKRKKLLFDHAAHDIRDIGHVGTISEAAFEAVSVEQRHKQLKIFFL
jgi:hypothetical protein